MAKQKKNNGTITVPPGTTHVVVVGQGGGGGGAGGAGRVQMIYQIGKNHPVGFNVGMTSMPGPGFRTSTPAEESPSGMKKDLLQEVLALNESEKKKEQLGVPTGWEARYDGPPPIRTSWESFKLMWKRKNK